MDSRNAQLIGVQAMPGWLSAWSMDDLAPLFQVDLPQGTGTPTYSGVSMNRFKYYGSLAVPPYVRSYTYAGATVSGFEDCLYPATAIYAGEERVYVALQGELGLPMKVDAYNVQDNRLVATQPTHWPVIQILPISGQQLMVLGNEAGVGKALVIDRSTMARDQELTLPGACIGGVTAHGRVPALYVE